MDSQFPICCLVHLAALLGVDMYVYLCSILGTSKRKWDCALFQVDSKKEKQFSFLVTNILKVIILILTVCLPMHRIPCKMK